MANKRYFKLKALSISNGRRKFRKEWGETYPEETLGPKLFDQYLKEGKIEQVSGPKGKQSGKKDDSEGIVEYDKITSNEIMEKLDEFGKEYDSGMSKKELYEIYSSSFSQ